MKFSQGKNQITNAQLLLRAIITMHIIPIKIMVPTRTTPMMGLIIMCRIEWLGCQCKIESGILSSIMVAFP